MSSAAIVPQRGIPSAVGRVFRSGRAWVIEGVGTLLWLALAAGCFRIFSGHGLRLAACLLLAACAVYIAAFIERTALRVFRRDRLARLRRGRRVYKVPHRKPQEWLPDASIVFVLFLALAGWNAVILQWLPVNLLGPWEWYEAVLAWLMFIVFWVPLEAAALLGERGLWSPAMRAWKRPEYWVWTLGCSAMCLLALLVLLSQTDFIHWMEGAERLGGGTLLMLALTYGIMLGAWLMVLAFVEQAIAAPEERSLEDTWD